MSRKKQNALWIGFLLLLTVSAVIVAYSHSRLANPGGNPRQVIDTGQVKKRSAEIPTAKNLSGLAIIGPPSKAEPSGPVQIVWFTVYEDGLWPTEAHVSPGLVRIYFEDRTRSSAGLVVQSPLGISTGQAVRQPRLFRGSTQVNLQAGRYRIFDASRPRSSSTLIVEPR